MASQLTQHRLLIQDENLNINQKKPIVDEKGKSSKTTNIRKGRLGLGIRKALSDITNKPTVQRETLTRTKNAPKEDFHIAEEKFLHDHNKCIEAQKVATEPSFLDTVLPGHDSMSFGFSESNPTKADDESTPCYPEPVELPMSEFSDWLQSSSRWESPHSCPTCWNSPPSSPLAWKFEPVQFMLRQENDC